MDAIQFIKEHGVKKARKVIEGAPEHWTTYTTGGGLGGGYIRCSGSVGQDEVSISDLKRLVESVDLVESLNSVETAKRYLEENMECSDFKLLKQAIADYKDIFGGEHV